MGRNAGVRNAGIGGAGSSLFTAALFALAFTSVKWGQAVFATQDGRGWLHSNGWKALAFHDVPECIWPILQECLYAVAVLTLMRLAAGPERRFAPLPILVTAVAMVACYAGVHYVLWSVGTPIVFILSADGPVWINLVFFLVLETTKLLALATLWLSVREGRFVWPYSGVTIVERNPMPFVCLVGGTVLIAWITMLRIPVFLVDPHWHYDLFRGAVEPIDLFRPGWDLARILLEKAWLVGVLWLTVELFRRTDQKF